LAHWIDEEREFVYPARHHHQNTTTRWEEQYGHHARFENDHRLYRGERARSFLRPLCQEPHAPETVCHAGVCPTAHVRGRGDVFSVLFGVPGESAEGLGAVKREGGGGEQAFAAAP